MNLKVREAISSDYNDISKLNAEVHNLHVENRPDVVENTDEKESVADSIVKIIDIQSIWILIQRILAYIDDFCGNSNYKRRGIGKLLFQYIVDYVRAEGASSLQLVVWEFNKGAIYFYNKMRMSTRNKKMELNL